MPPEKLIVIFVVYGLLNILLFYINFLFVIPRFLHSKKYWQYVLAAFGLVVILGFTKYLVALYFHDYVLLRADNQSVSFGSYFLTTLFTGLIFVFLSIVLKFSMDWFVNDRIRKDLENQKLSAELAFLKSQINPHFLFNSLNSIYSLAYQQSENTAGAILKLSEIMRYMLYECNDQKVELGKELQYLENFIDLQKLRLGPRAQVHFEINGIFGHQQIAPMVLISFVENGFKHGIATDVNHPIYIKIDVEDYNLKFFMSNKKSIQKIEESGGIGLINAQRRLDLLYDDRYQLIIKDEPENYTCELFINL
jgi:two-component system LytT family sensor kinase